MREVDLTNELPTCSFLFPYHPKPLKEKDFERKLLLKIIDDDEYELPAVGSTVDRDESVALRVSPRCKEGVVDPFCKPYLLGARPLGLFLLDDLQAIDDGWRLPKPAFLANLLARSGVQQNSYCSVDVREIMLREDTDTGSLDMMRAFVKEQIETDTTKFPAQHVALSAVYVQIEQVDQEHLFNIAASTPDKIAEKIYVPRLNSRTSRQKFPVAILLGNGTTWMQIIRFPVFREFEDGEDRFLMNFQKLAVLRDDWIEFFSNLPTIVGVDIDWTLRELKQFLSTFFGLDELQLPGSVDLRSLALTLGYNFEKLSLFTLNLLFTGSIINKEISTGDQGFWKSWRRTPKVFRNHFVSIVRAPHIVYVVMMGCLVRNLFPDPATICNALQRNQDASLQWVASVIAQCLKNTFPSQRTWCVESRKRLVQELKVDGVVPQRIVFLSEILPDFPNITSGGPRDLHYVRQFFSRQIYVLSKLDFHHGDSVDYREVHNDQTIMFGRSKVVQNLCPVPSGGLMANPEVEPLLFEMMDDAGRINFTSDYIFDQYRFTETTVSLMIVEWARLNPSQFKIFMSEIAKKDVFSPEYYKVWASRASIYEGLKTLYKFMFDEFVPVTIEPLDRLIYNRKHEVQRQELDTLGRATKRVEDIKTRIECMVTSESKFARAQVSQVNVQGAAYQNVPGENAARNKKWRDARRARKNKKLRTGELPYDPDWKLTKLKAMRDSRCEGASLLSASANADLLREKDLQIQKLNEQIGELQQAIDRDNEDRLYHEEEEDYYERDRSRSPPRRVDY